MSSPSDQFSVPPLLTCAGLVVIALYTFWSTGFRINTTPSVPRGLYKIAAGPVQRGDLASYCLDPLVAVVKERQYLASGSCQSGLRPLVKEVAGLPGDEISVGPDGISVNGHEQLNSAAKAFDKQGRPTPESHLESGIIPAGLALLLAHHPGSFDGRYFGLVRLSDLRRVEAVLTITKPEAL
jgi:conjugative transfer signal peptidase TraF